MKSPPALALAAALVLTAAPPCAGADDAALRDTMHLVASEFGTVLALSSRAGRDAAVDARLSEAMDEIADQGFLLASHAERDDVSLMASSLAQLVGALRIHHRRRAARDFNATLDLILETCSGCHRRTSEGHGSRFAQALLTDEVLSTASAYRRVHLFVATRQFERARTDLDAAIARADVWDALEPLLALRMDLAIRILPDLTRLQDQLEQIKNATSLPPHALGTLDGWLESLDAVRRLEARDASPSITAAALVEAAEAQPAREYARPLYLAASRVTRDLLGDASLERDDRASALLLAGIAEDGLGAAPTLPLRELYLEMAIVEAPHTATARTAFARLDRVVRIQFTGEPLPDEIAEHLDRLETRAAPYR